MKETLKKLRERNAGFNGPCDATKLLKLASSLQCELPGDVVALYQDHDGSSSSAGLAFRLMPVSEVEKSFHAFEKIDFPTHDFRAFWYDDNSNYAGVYVVGPMKCKVCFVDHEETDLSPVFQSVSRFYDSMLQSIDDRADFRHLITDYPKVKTTGGSPESDPDGNMAKELLQEAEQTADEDRRRHLAFCAMALLPFSEVAPLLRMARSSDMWVQEQACKILGVRKCREALPVLNEVIASGTHNGKAAAKRAVGQIRQAMFRSSNN